MGTDEVESSTVSSASLNGHATFFDERGLRRRGAPDGLQQDSEMRPKDKEEEEKEKEKKEQRRKAKTASAFFEDATVDEKEIKALERYSGFFGFLRVVREELPNFYTFRQYCRQTMRDIWRNKITFVLGFSACFLVVLVVAMMVSVLSHTPVVFLSLAELEQGEIDVTLQPMSSTGFDFFNYTLVSEILDEDPLFQFHTPREYFTSHINHFYDPRLCDNSVKRLGNDSTWMYTGLPNINSPCQYSGDCYDELCSGSLSLFLSCLIILLI